MSTELGPGGQNLPLSVLGTVVRRLPGRFAGVRRVVFPFPDEGRQVAEEIAVLLGSGALRPLIDRETTLEGIVEAYRYVETGEKIGRVVVRM